MAKPCFSILVAIALALLLPNAAQAQGAQPEAQRLTAENEASRRYQTSGLLPIPAYPLPSSQTSWLRLPARQLSAPLLTVTF